MAYADYTYYSTTYGGKLLTAETYPKAAEKATIFMDKATQGRITETTTEVKMCCCELAETIYNINCAGGVKQSESVGSYSYTLAATSGTNTAEGLQLAVCRSWLPNDLLYRGVM